MSHVSPTSSHQPMEPQTPLLPSTPDKPKPGQEVEHPEDKHPFLSYTYRLTWLAVTILALAVAYKLNKNQRGGVTVKMIVALFFPVPYLMQAGIRKYVTDEEGYGVPYYDEDKELDALRESKRGSQQQGSSPAIPSANAESTTQ